MYWLTTGGADELVLALAVDSHIVDHHVFQPHIFARLKKKRRHRKMDDVEVPQRNAAHPFGPARDQGGRSERDRTRGSSSDGDPLDVAVLAERRPFRPRSRRRCG